MFVNRIEEFLRKKGILMKTAIVLSGGGAKGAFQVGVLQKLYEGGLKPDVVYGTSVGALNACGLSHMGIDGLTDVWKKIESKSDILTFRWDFLWGDSFYSLSPLRKKIEKIVFNNEPKCEGVSCYIDFKKGSVNYASNMKMDRKDYAKFTEASSAIPGVMEPVEKFYLDGGVRENTPLGRAIEDGAEKIIVIVCNPIGENPIGEWEPSWPKIVSYGLRAADIGGHEIFLNDVRRCQEYNNRSDKRFIDLTVFAPDAPPMDTLEFEPEKIRAAIEHGRVVAGRSLLT